MKRIFNTLCLILLTLWIFPVLGATYQLPSQASSLPGGFCSQNGSDVNCPGNLIFAANDSIIVDSNMRLVISGDFTFGDNFAVNTAGQTSALQIIVAGNVNPGSGSILNANMTISGSINSASGTSNTGNMVVSGNLNLGDNSTVSGNITASDVNIGNGVNISGNISAQNITVGNNTTITVGNNTTITGNISTGDININGADSLIDGNINATGTVTNNGTVTGYVNANNINDNSGGIDDSRQCDIDTSAGENTGPCPVTAPVLYQWLEFEQDSWSGANAVLDSSTHNRSGSAIGSASPVVPSEQVSCKVLDIPASSSTSSNNAVNTNIAAHNIGNSGTISFWYRSHQAWNSGAPRQLFDASTDANGNSLDKYFYLTLTDNGSLRFGLEDSNDADLDVRTGAYSFAANQWVHIAVSWNVGASQLKIFVNGAEASVTSNGGTLNGQIASLNSLYIGDNRANYFGGPSSTANSANGQFDDLRIYQGQQNAGEVSADMADVSPCSTQLAYYQFEQQQWISSGDVLDSSDNLNHATALGSASPLFPTVQKSCKVLDIPFNSSQSARSAINTGIDVNSIGNKGSISFWYRSNQAWNSGGDRQLFDATNNSTGNVGTDQVFFLTLTASGALHFSLEDSDDLNLWVVTNSNFSFAANEWVHIAVTWDMSSNALRIFVNGSQQATSGDTQAGVGPNLGNYATLYIGDSRSSYVIANQPHTHNSANGQFDDVRIYNTNQSASAIATDMADLNPCANQVIFYQFEEESWSGNNSIIDSSGNNHHGTPFEVTPVLPSNQKSCQAMLVPDNRTLGTQQGLHTNFDVNELGNAGTISFWFQSVDAWQSAGRYRVLFDASSGSNRFVFYILDNGVLGAQISESDGDTRTINSQTSYDFPSNTWVHLALSWNAQTDQMTIYVNGSAISQLTSGAYLDEGLANLTTLGIGDNRSTSSSTSPIGASADGYFDDVRVYGYVQSQSEVDTDRQTISPCAFVDHYRLTFSVTGYTCAASSIRVSACSDSDCSSLYPFTSQLTMLASSGSYSQSNLSFVGSTQVSLIKDEPGTVTLGTEGREPFAPMQCFEGNSRVPCQIDFKQGGLTVSWGTEITPENDLQHIPDQDSQVPLNQPIYINNNTNGACAADLAGKALMLAVKCTNPASCNSDMLNLSGATINQPESYTDTGIVFNADGKAVIPANTIRYDDAGQIQLLVKDSAELTAGASNEFVEMPKLKLEYIANVADPASDPLITAGINFGLSITAIGQLDVVTPNYQPGQLQLKADRLSPTGVGVEGSLVISNATVAGQDSITTGSGYIDFVNNLANISLGQSQDLQAYYSEVGEISLQVQDNNYLAPLGLTVESQNSLHLGRFIPAYFSISDNAPKLVEACTTGLFSYTGQRIAMTLDPTITIMPKNVLGNNIHNYIGALKKLNTDSADPDDVVISELSIFTQMPDIDPQEIVSQSLTGGEITVAIEQDDEEEDGEPIGVIYQKLATPIVPFDAHLQIDFSEEYLTDTDGVCYQTDYDPATSAGCERYSIENIDGAHLRYGRLVMENTYGPETESLSIPMFTQYYNASGNWVLNSDDKCTPYDSANAVLDEENSELDPADIPARSGAGTFSAGKPTSLSDSISVAAPGEGNQLEFPLLMNQPDYLFFDWDGDGTIQAPSAIITFGQYRGNDRIINWREVFK
ncbi:DUF6701 domain-containing protein [Neptunicella sp. SCSIO 80796]|uniref:DUF6701 domain-containing protein n=1 Tax=Neptunicella plasticusilytica TaxID=3117012 RepID=UPI003A4DDF8F